MARAAVDWLLASAEPAVRALTRRDLLDEEPDEDVLSGPIVRKLFAGQRPDGGFGVAPYRKWTGAHWRLVSLAELGVPAGEPRALAALEPVLTWRRRAQARVPVIDGLARVCGSIDGNVLAVSCALGLAEDPRVAGLAERLLEWQWPDGGWNCDRAAGGHRSSFHETLLPAWGLHAHGTATGNTDALAGAARAAELLLSHNLFRASGGAVIDHRWLVPHYPVYWHYDTLQALLVLSRMDKVRDERASEALDLLEEARDAEPRWSAGRPWWRPPGSRVAPEVVDWDAAGPQEMVTLNALRVLRRAGR
ncbi:hypothetical protein [Amycolatopsis coloradensis]|uniref:hypothetical protein n=1 Tax=Amycolatopsis coloradensis TaxID=76021 RepID=UPI001FC953EF|nr:hypothetical protein [Amycolatopsis coloradensis]